MVFGDSKRYILIALLWYTSGIYIIYVYIIYIYIYIYIYKEREREKRERERERERERDGGFATCTLPPKQVEATKKRSAKS